MRREQFTNMEQGKEKEKDIRLHQLSSDMFPEGLNESLAQSKIEGVRTCMENIKLAIGALKENPDKKSDIVDLVEENITEAYNILETSEEIDHQTKKSLYSELRKLRKEFNFYANIETSDTTKTLESLLGKIRTGIHTEIVKKSSYTPERKLEIIDLIKTDIKEAESLVSKLDENEKKATLRRRLEKLKHDFKLISENTKRFLTGKQPRKEVPEKIKDIPKKNEVTQAEVDYRSDQIAVLFGEVNKAIYSESTELNEIIDLSKKTTDALASAQAGRVIDNFSKEKIDENEKERIILKLTDYAKELQKKGKELFLNNLAFVREQAKILDSEATGDVDLVLVDDRIHSLLKYLNENIIEEATEIQVELNEINKLISGPLKKIHERNLKGEDLAKRIHRAEDMNTLSYEQLLEYIGQKNNTAPDQIDKELEMLQTLIETISDDTVNFEFTYGSKDTEKELTSEDRRGEVLSFLKMHHAGLLSARDRFVKEREKENIFKKATTFAEIREIILSLGGQENIGDIPKETVLLTIGEFEDVASNPDSDTFVSTPAIEEVPEAFGLRKAVLRVYQLELKKKTESTAEEREVEMRKYRSILTDGDITHLEFESIDQALSEPGFANFLHLQDVHTGKKRNANAVEKDNSEHVRAQYEVYLAAREVAAGLKRILEKEVQKDFEGRISFPEKALGNIDDYILDTAVKNPSEVANILQVVRNNTEIPGKIEKLEGDIRTAYGMFTNVTELKKAEEDLIEKERLLQKLKSHTGQNKQDLAEYYVKNGFARENFFDLINPKALDRVLKEGEIKCQKERDLAHKKMFVIDRYRSSIAIANSSNEISEALSKMQSEIPDEAGEIFNDEETGSLMRAENTQERQLIIETARARALKQKSKYVDLISKTNEALKSKSLSWAEPLKKSNIVDSLIEQGLLDKDTGIYNKTIGAGGAIRLAANRLEQQIAVDKLSITTVRDRITEIESQKRELNRIYTQASGKLFFGITAIGEARKNIEEYVRDQIFNEDVDDDVDIQEKIERGVAESIRKIRRGKKESDEEFKARQTKIAHSERERLATELLENAEERLATIEHVRSLDNNRYVSKEVLEDAKTRAQKSIEASLRVRIDHIFEEDEKKSPKNITEIESLIRKMIIRPPKIVVNKNTKSGIELVAKDKNITKEESVRYIINILKEKLAKMNKTSDGAKRILLGRIIANIESKQN